MEEGERRGRFGENYSMAKKRGILIPLNLLKAKIQSVNTPEITLTNLGAVTGKLQICINISDGKMGEFYVDEAMNAATGSADDHLVGAFLPFTDGSTDLQVSDIKLKAFKCGDRVELALSAEIKGVIKTPWTSGF